MLARKILLALFAASALPRASISSDVCSNSLLLTDACCLILSSIASDILLIETASESNSLSPVILFLEEKSPAAIRFAILSNLTIGEDSDLLRKKTIIIMETNTVRNKNIKLVNISLIG